MSTGRADEIAALTIFDGYSTATLAPLAAQLHPLAAAAGQVLMHQGELAVSFLLIRSGRAEVTHTGFDTHDIVVEVGAGLIVGEIALLRHAPRTATVVATEPLTGWIGDREAFSTILELPGMTTKLVRTARQRLAAFITPIPVRVRDGSEFHLRPVLPGDNERISSGAVAFSDETLYRRFQTARAPSETLMVYLFEVDYVDHFVWVLTDGADGPAVADARFVRDRVDPALAEVAFTAGDDYQGRGVGSFLMEALVVAAQCGGIERFSARALAENYPMRKILDRFGAVWHRDELSVISAVVDVPQPGQLHLSARLSHQIRDMARQVMRAVG